MTVEHEIVERLRATAERFDADAPPVAKIVRRARRRSRLRLVGVAASVVALLGGATAIGYLVGDRPEATRVEAQGDEGRRSREAVPEVPPVGDRSVDFQSGLEGEEAYALTTGTTTTVIPAPSQSDAEVAPEPDAALSEQIVKTAEIDLEVRRGRFQGAYAEAQRLTKRYGGFVTEASTAGTDARSGDITIRVPASRFEDLVADLKGLGVLRGEHVSGLDVSADFIDLNARLRNWEAQERVLVRLMNGADTIDETIRVQRELGDVRVRIEKIRGQLRLLRDQTELGTVTVALHEPGVGPKPPEKDEPSALARAWDGAVGGALQVISATLVGLGYVVPLLALLVIAWLGIRAVRSRLPA